MAEDFDLNFNFTSNTGSAVQGFERLAAISKQIREDFDTLTNAMDGVNERAEKMRSYYTSNVELLEKAKSLLQAMSTIEQGNLAMQNQNLVVVNEILNSVRGLGGNMGQAMQMLGAAGAGGWGGYNSGRGSGSSSYYETMMNDPFYGGSPTSPVDFTKNSQSSHLGGVAESEREFHHFGSSLKKAPRLFKKFGFSQPGSSGSAGDVFGEPSPPSGSTSGGGGRVPPPPSSPPSYGGDDDDMGDPTGKGKVPHFDESVLKPSSVLWTPRGAQYRPTSVSIQDQLDETPFMKSYIPQGMEHKAGIIAYDLIDSELTRVLGKTGLGGKVHGRIREAMTLRGMSKKSIRLETQNAVESMPDPENPGQTIHYRTEGMKEGGYEQATVKFAETVHKILANSVVSMVSSTMGKALMAKEVFNIAQDVAGAVRNYSYLAQSQGNVFGQVDYGRSLSMGLQAQLKSGFGLNPFYSAQDVAKAQMAGAALGLKGGGLQNYVNQAMQFQQQFGLTASESQQFIAAGLGAGVGISTNAAGIASLRQLENTTQTSTIYGNQAYVTGMSSSASMGLTGSAATEAGVLAAGFGAGNQILQQANLNGTEGTGTQLMNALTSQQLGVPYLGLYSAEQKLKGVSGGNKAVMAQDKGIMNILGNLGINPSSIKKKSDLNSYAMELSMILPSLVGDQKLADPQLAVNWVWAKIQQMHNITHPKKKPAQGSLFMSLVDDVGKAVLGVGGAVRATANTLAHYNIDTGAEIAGLVSGRSQTQINHWIQSADHSIDNVEHGASTGIDQIRHGAATVFDQNRNGMPSAMVGGFSSSARSTIEVKVHPASAMAISASLKHFNQQRNTSNIPLNHLGQV